MLSVTSEHALRALIYIAGLPEGQFALGGDIASHAGVRPNYLSKILHTLKKAGLVETSRGTGGGYRLNRPADEILLIDVAELFEGPRAHLGCLLGNHMECADESPCPAHATWRDIRSRYVAFMDRTTLEEIAGDRPAAYRESSAGAPRDAKRRTLKTAAARTARGAASRRKSP